MMMHLLTEELSVQSVPISVCHMIFSLIIRGFHPSNHHSAHTHLISFNFSLFLVLLWAMYAELVGKSSPLPFKRAFGSNCRNCRGSRQPKA